MKQPEQTNYIDQKLIENRLHQTAAISIIRPQDKMLFYAEISNIAIKHPDLEPLANDILKQIANDTVPVKVHDRHSLLTFLGDYLTPEDKKAADRISLSAICYRAINQAQTQIRLESKNGPAGFLTMRRAIDFLAQLYTELSISRQFVEDNGHELKVQEDELSEVTMGLMSYLQTLSIGMSVGDAFREVENQAQVSE